MNKTNFIKNIPQTIQNLIQDFLETHFSDCKIQEEENESNTYEFYDLEFEEHEVLIYRSASSSRILFDRFWFNTSSCPDENL